MTQSPASNVFEFDFGNRQVDEMKRRAEEVAGGDQREAEIYVQVATFARSGEPWAQRLLEKARSERICFHSWKRQLDNYLYDLADARAARWRAAEAQGYAADAAHAYYMPGAPRLRPSPAEAAPRVKPAPEVPRAKPITATPYKLRPAASIPSRDCLDGGHRFRKFVSVTVAPGGVGKTALVLAEVLEMVTGRALLGGPAPQRCRVWFWCGEDPRDELDRRIAAACLHYGIKAEDVEGWLFVDTGREQKMIVATETKDGVKIAEPLVEEITATIRERKIDLLVVDPFVASHEVNENDNARINRVARVYADRIADPCNCAVELIHHVRKGNGGEVTAEDARGASALRDAARSVRAINGMTEEQWAKAGVSHNRKRYFRIDDTHGKQSMMPPADASTWYHLENVDLGNPTDGRPSDKVGVVVRWHYPDASDGLPADALDRVKATIASVAGWRFDVQSKDHWVGKAVALALGLNLDIAAQLEQTKRLLRDWIEAGDLVVVERVDEHRKVRKFVEVNTAKKPSPRSDADEGLSSI